MKGDKKLGLLCVLAVFVGCSESGSPQQRVADRVGDLVQVCSNKNGDYSGAAGWVVYTGSDRARKYKDVVSAEGEDRSYLNSTCYHLSKLLDGGRSYTLVKYSTETESEGVWHIQEMKFPSGKAATLAFLEIGGTMALADIDS